MINSILFFLSGIGVFLFGLSLLTEKAMQTGENLIKYKMQKFLTKPIGATTIGILTTGIIQSSSATNSFAVSLTDKNLIDKKSAFYLIMGSNIGTTSTAYLALVAKLNFSYILASLIFFSILINMAVSNKKTKNITILISCLSLIFIGLIIVKDSISPFQGTIYSYLVNQRGYFSLFLFAMMLTALFQSSSLTTVFLITMATLNVIDLTAAMIMIMGINLGSCLTVFLSTIGCSNRGWAVAFFHLIFNIIGIVLNLFLIKTGLLNFLFVLNCDVYIKIALYHTFFNVSTTLLLFYFIPEISILLKFKQKKAKLRVFIL